MTIIAADDTNLLEAVRWMIESGEALRLPNEDLVEFVDSIRSLLQPRQEEVEYLEAALTHLENEVQADTYLETHH